MESRRALRKPNQASHGPMTSTVKKDGATFVPTRNKGQPPTSPIPHTSRLSFVNMSKSKRRKAPRYILLITDAIKAVGDEKKGASVQAIKKWILDNHPEILQRPFNNSVNRALMKGLDNGLLARPAKSKINRGAFGSFLLAKKTVKVKKTEIAPKVKAAVLPGAYSSDTELTINRGRAMSLRLNLSDTQLTEVRKSLVFKANAKMRRGSPFKKVASEDTDEDSEQEGQWNIKRLGGRSVKKIVAQSDDGDSDEDSEQEDRRNVVRNVLVKRLGGRYVKNVEVESDDGSSEDSEQEKQIEPAAKAQTKNPTESSKATGTKNVAKPPRKAPPIKTKDKKEKVPSKPKRKPKK